MENLLKEILKHDPKLADLAQKIAAKGIDLSNVMEQFGVFQEKLRDCEEPIGLQLAVTRINQKFPDVPYRDYVLDKVSSGGGEPW